MRNVLDAEGWTTLYLGPNLPVDSFIQAVERYRPHLVCVSATTPKTRSAFHKDCIALHTATQRMGAHLMIGGSATMQHGAGDIATDYVPASIADALRWIETQYGGRMS